MASNEHGDEQELHRTIDDNDTGLGDHPHITTSLNPSMDPTECPRARQELHAHVHDDDEGHHLPITTSSDSSPVVTEWSRCRRVSEMAFPFLKLQKKAETRGIIAAAGSQYFTSRPEEEVFIILGITFVATVIMFVYLLLTISCWNYEIEDGDVKLDPRVPKMGAHYGIVIFVKEGVQLAVLHRLCGVLMEPNMELHEHRTDRCERVVNGRRVSLLEETHGVARFFLQGLRYLQFRIRKSYSRHAVQPQPKWLSTFVADHILLFGVGFGAIGHQVSLLWLKLQWKGIDLHKTLGQNHVTDILLAIACTHMAIQVMGFLYCTLECNAVPKKERKKEFGFYMSLFIVLWMVDFLAIVFDRQVFTAPWHGSVPYVHRFFAAVAQIFVSHSTVMLGAVFLGHSCHFTKSPDLEWKVFWTHAVPFFLVLALYIAGMRCRRLHHLELSCAPSILKFVSEVWPYVNICLEIVFGFVLLCLSLLNSRSSPPADLENGELMNIFDYDKALVCFTFSAAILYSINQIFYAWGMHLTWSWLTAILTLLGPIGLASFTLSVWRWPPRIRSGGKRGKILGTALWVALLVAATSFVDFQDKEDCEICSDLPGCCAYPYLPDWNALEERSLICDRGKRCAQKNFSPKLNTSMYCVLPPSDSEDGEAEARRLFSAEHRYDLQASDDQSCRVMKERWNEFVKNRIALLAEVEKEEESVATVFRLLNTFGQAASVEMYFTIFGVLLKVIFRSWHKHSEDIFDLGHHQHHEDHHGNHACVCVGRTCAAPDAASQTGRNNDLSRSRTTGF